MQAMVEEDSEAMTSQAFAGPVQAADGIQASEVSIAVSQDGVDGDDELDEDDAADEEEEDEQGVEEEEEEPRLKYQRLGGSVPGIISSAGASCLTVGDRILALGTSDGTVHLLDYQGNQVKELPVHTAAVNELCFDAEGEYIGSCSDDGTVVVSSLYSDEKERHEYHRPVKSVALDPEHGRKSSRQFVSGGLAGQLIFNTKGWLGARDQVLHSGEGPIHAIKWRTSLIAWANNTGVKIFDTATQRRLSFIERPPESPRPELVRPHIVWQDDAVCVIGWADCVRVAAVRTRVEKNRVLGTAGALSADLLGRGGKTLSSADGKYVEIVAMFKTEYFISGLAPYGDALVVLAYVPRAEPGSKGQTKSTNQKQVGLEFLGMQGDSNWPEVHIVTWKNEELASDALSVLGYEHYEAKDYLLAHAPFVGSSSAGGQWAEGYEPLYYIVSPKDVVIARPRDAEDHVSWLLQHGWHEKALAAVEAGNGRKELLDEVGSRYLDHLVLERRYAQAAALCPKLLRGSATAWERWIFNFAQLRQLPKLAPYVPTSNPRLKDSVYEIVLNSLLINPAHHEQLLTTIQTWPKDIYSVKTIINAVELQMNTSLRSSALQEVLLVLCIMEGQHEKALAILVELQKPNVFDFIEEHNLYAAVRDKVIPLMVLDGKRAVSLYIQQSNRIPASDVVPQLLKAAKDDEQYKPLLHLYLHALFEKDPNAGKNFHYLQVELYAQYEPRLLLPFLRSSQHYSLDKAYEVCKRRNLTKEMVFILGRMGNTRDALSLIINRLKDMEQAINFVTAQHDDELWDELINQCINNPEMVGALLEHTVGNVDPLHLINKVPLGMSIPQLRDRLVKIISDYRTEMSLRHGCNNILKADCVDLLVRYYHEARHAIRVGGPEGGVDVGGSGSGGGKPGPKQLSAAPGRTSSKAFKTARRTNVGGSGRCCICLDPVGLQNVAVVAFFCTHAYHITCLNDPSSISRTGGEKGQFGNVKSAERDSGLGDSRLRDGKGMSVNGDVPGSSEPKGSQMRCILCTTAASASKRKGEDIRKTGQAGLPDTTSNGWGG